MKKTEKDLENQCCAYARQRGFLAVKLENNGHRGIPDRVFIKKGGKCFFVEFKRPGGKVSEYQKFYSDFLSPYFEIIDDFNMFTELFKKYQSW